MKCPFCDHPESKSLIPGKAKMAFRYAGEESVFPVRKDLPHMRESKKFLTWL